MSMGSCKHAQAQLLLEAFRFVSFRFVSFRLAILSQLLEQKSQFHSARLVRRNGPQRRASELLDSLSAAAARGVHIDTAGGR